MGWHNTVAAGLAALKLPKSAASDSTQLQLSVMIPARNEAATIRECLSSLVKESEYDSSLGRDWELIVIDDASSDATRQIAKAIIFSAAS